ncbi:MAG: cyclopropane fatty acyl phospholipid synthase [Candidatus Uhrbacteria bacterium]|nr:cyclopropane fatty acyl phospholipid synthase [Candidatus Uhrbacteria bacterium]
MNAKTEDRIQKLLDGTGITLNGSEPWDPQIKNARFFERVLAQGSLGLGEAYMDGWWECEGLDEFIARVLRLNVDQKLGLNLPIIWEAVKAKVMNRQAGKRAYHIGKAHYDMGNDLYRAMLDDRMVYTCGYWKDAQSLNEAQVNKLDLVCRKIGLKRGDRVLDIGCGWGSFAKFAAERYGASVVGITVSSEQAELARKLCAGLPIEIRLQDYTAIHEKFDHVVSLGMVEHVGEKNYRKYFKVARRCLKDDGLFLLHTIGSLKSTATTDPWIEKYIFPNSTLPSLKQLAKASEGLFVTEDVHNFGKDYEKTLLEWNTNFEEHWEQLKHRYDERFYRMWRYYLLSCAGFFRARKGQLWQIVYSKNGVVEGYKSVR